MNENTTLLKDILATLREIRDSLRSGGAVAGGAPSSAASSGKGGQVAGDRELDSEWGNPSVRKDPKRWVGDSFAGCRLSECPPAYLDQLADLYDWMGDKDEEENKLHKGKPTAPYKRRDAARCRGWAKRLREGWKPPVGSAGGGDDQSPQDYGGAGAGAGEDPLPF